MGEMPGEDTEERVEKELWVGSFLLEGAEGRGAAAEGEEEEFQELMGAVPIRRRGWEEERERFGFFGRGGSGGGGRWGGGARMDWYWLDCDWWGGSIFLVVLRPFNNKRK